MVEYISPPRSLTDWNDIPAGLVELLFFPEGLKNEIFKIALLKIVELVFSSFLLNIYERK